MPTQSDASPVEPLGALARIRVEVDSRMKEFDATGPVLKTGPNAAYTEVMAAAVRTKRIWMREYIVSILRWVRA